MIKKILIADRGEIAVRIIRACRDLGITSVAVYSKEDCQSLHVKLADDSICIGQGPLSHSYLNQINIISAALTANADAIHPGSGLLSENADFARRCQEFGLIFIGPKPEVIEQTGNKPLIRAIMSQAQIPIFPDSSGPITDLAEAKKAATSMGFPLIMKASSGDSDTALQISYSAHDFEEKFRMAQNEASRAFGNPALSLEKIINNPKHIAIQVMADQFGQVVILGERDCSIQDHHQSSIIESPSPDLDDQTRQALNQAAIRAVKAVQYSNAGTVTFIVDQNKQIYFSEMTSRIQAEHGVTEMVSGIDLIMEQILVASGLPLSFTQEDIANRGHAMACHITTNSSSQQGGPNDGLIKHLHLPAGHGVRVDTALYTGYKVPIDHDTRLAKLIVHAPNRKAAIGKMKTALDELLILGLETNLDALYDFMHQPQFMEGKSDTSFTAQLLTNKEKK